MASSVVSVASAMTMAFVLGGLMEPVVGGLVARGTGGPADAQAGKRR